MAYPVIPVKEELDSVVHGIEQVDQVDLEPVVPFDEAGTELFQDGRIRQEFLEPAGPRTGVARNETGRPV